jgi:hypothetical protein
LAGPESSQAFASAVVPGTGRAVATTRRVHRLEREQRPEPLEHRRTVAGETSNSGAGCCIEGFRAAVDSDQQYPLGPR